MHMHVKNYNGLALQYGFSTTEFKNEFGKEVWTRKTCWKAEEYRGRQSAEGCHQIVQKDATKLCGRMPPNCLEGCHQIVQYAKV
jgi:hypothetical protein